MGTRGKAQKERRKGRKDPTKSYGGVQALFDPAALPYHLPPTAMHMRELRSRKGIAFLGHIVRPGTEPGVPRWDSGAAGVQVGAGDRSLVTGSGLGLAGSGTGRTQPSWEGRVMRHGHMMAQKGQVRRFCLGCSPFQAARTGPGLWAPQACQPKQQTRTTSPL